MERKMEQQRIDDLKKRNDVQNLSDISQRINICDSCGQRIDIFGHCGCYD